jgi:hypothetical protein
VAKTGYNISGSPKSTAIYYYTSSGGGGGGPTTWTAVSNSILVSDDTVRGIAYGGGKWVAVSNNTTSGGKIAYSTDGTSWTAVTDTTFRNASIYAIAYGNGTFVAVGQSGRMATSTDGVTWTAVTYTSSTFWQYYSGSENKQVTASIYGIAYGNGKFVAVGSGGGKMAYSADATSWTALSTISTTFDNAISINGIAYGNGMFVAVGSSGKMAYSTDGASWTAVSNSTFGNTIDIGAIAYGNGKFVAVGEYGRMATSANGASWTAVGTASNTSDIYAIAYGNGMFVAGGEYGKMAYSTDGATWTAVSDSTFGQYTDTNGNVRTSVIRGIAYGSAGNAGGKFVAGGTGGKMAYADWPEE